MKAFILLSVIAVAFATECGENEHFESCGTACPLTCENYQNPPKFCNFMCKIGCACDEGYVRSADGRCVKPEECPVPAPELCGENEQFEKCGTPCPLTCENYQNPPKFCIKRCDIGCHCKEGYVRAANGKCVKPEECPKPESTSTKHCGENQHFESCGTVCPLTCDNFDNPPKFCNLMCREGCFCDKGYVMTDDLRCVRPSECPARAVCGENQRYKECGTACPLTCDNYDNPPKMCVAMCVAGCHCEPGYVKTSDGRCVRPENCPSKSQQCRSDEQYYPDIPDCTNDCKNLNNPAPVCPQYFVPRPGCFCKEGLWKRKDGKCVTPENCSPPDAALELCQMPAETGMCKGYFPRYFFNQETGKCEKFIYGGCRGNKNNFETLEECHNTCGSS